MREIVAPRMLEETWTWFQKCNAALRLLIWTVPVIICTSCTTQFTVDTSTHDPLIYGPGTEPAKDLDLRLDGFKLGCKQRLVKTKFGPILLAQSRWLGSHAPLRAYVPNATVREIAIEVRSAAFEELVSAFEKMESETAICKVEFKDKDKNENKNKDKNENVVNLLAAEALIRQLPQPYSKVLQNSYNHHIWPPGDKTQGISMDMSAGMRLRLENSVAIPPAGIGAGNAHPSAFAAPTFLYFHTLTASELCDPGSLRAYGHICSEKYHPNTWESISFLSPSGGLARLGLTQEYETKSKKQSQNFPDAVQKCVLLMKTLEQVSRSGGALPVESARECANFLFRLEEQEAFVHESSSLLDLLERPADGGVGASKWWRLWLPAHRDTLLSKGLDYGGSPESFDRPLLLSAGSLEELQQIPFDNQYPCGGEIVPGVNCFSLHYRVMPIPEILIQVNGQREWVPVGTTLHDLLAERLHASSAPRVAYLSVALDTLPAPPMREAIFRSVLETVRIRRYSWDGAYDLQALKLFTATDLARFMRLQLLPGDEIRWN
jgi:hypothetical protein